jgi:2',3'-cyclic-nucleotide 2'-phosphodiesterase/3'-nucleotidase/5'-nucleotidase
MPLPSRSAPATNAQAAVNTLMDRGVDKIIALTHTGYEEDVVLARVITGVAVIVGRISTGTPC